MEGSRKVIGKPFLEMLPKGERSELVASLRIERYNSGESLMIEDDESDDVFLVLSGSAVVEIVSAEGKQTIYRQIETGAVLGELSAIDGGTRSANVFCRSDMEAVRLSRARFKELVDTNSSFRWALLNYMAQQMRTMTGRIFEYSTMLVADRLIAELIRRGVANGELNGFAKIAPAPRHHDLAAHLSTHREAVSREMSRLAKLGLVTKSAKNALELNLHGLRRMLEERRVR